MASKAKVALRRLLFPIYGYFEPRFQGLHEHLDQAVLTHADRRFNSVDERLMAIHQHIDATTGRVVADVQTAAEFAATFRRATDRLHADLHGLRMLVADGVEDDLPRLLQASREGDEVAAAAAAKVLAERYPLLADAVAGTLTGADRPGEGLARLLDWGASHQGPAASAGLWFNPAVTVHHTGGTVELGDVNERIVEVPYVYAAVAGLPAGSRILDFGAGESTVALSLASLGHVVTALDLRPSSLAHPNLRGVVAAGEAWEGPDAPQDAIVSISALEHVGIGAYGEAGTDDLGLDRRMVERFARWLKPGGELVLTAPFGQWSVDELQRVYDDAHLEELLAGWTITDRRVLVREDRRTWVPAPADVAWHDRDPGVVLLRATPPG